MYYKNVWSELTEKLKIRNTPGNSIYICTNKQKQTTNKQIPITKIIHWKYNTGGQKKILKAIYPIY